jgi:hypothetical protein
VISHLPAAENVSNGDYFEAGCMDAVCRKGTTKPTLTKGRGLTAFGEFTSLACDPVSGCFRRTRPHSTQLDQVKWRARQDSNLRPQA